MSKSSIPSFINRLRSYFLSAIDREANVQIIELAFERSINQSLMPQSEPEPKSSRVPAGSKKAKDRGAKGAETRRRNKAEREKEQTDRLASIANASGGAA